MPKLGAVWHDTPMRDERRRMTMPWNNGKRVIESRLDFINLATAKESSVAQLCRDFGISRKTAYKWMGRHLRGEGLEDRSRRPVSSPGATTPDIVDRVLDMRARHPFLGGRKIGLILKRQGVADVPSGNTITSIIRAHGLLDKRNSREAQRYVRFRKDKANEMWQCDFLGHFALKDGSRCHTLNVIDDHSRFCLCCAALPNERFESVKPVFESLFMAYGMPKTLLCDNGKPWGAAVEGARGGITSFEAWMMDLGVLVIHGKPYHPQTQGKEERFNKSFAREAKQYARLDDFPSAQSSFDRYREFYNNERPHMGIDDLCPKDLYHPSETAFTTENPAWEYPAGACLRRVQRNGRVDYKGRTLAFSYGMMGRTVAMLPSKGGSIVNIIYRQFLLARYNMSTGEYQFVRPYLVEGDPRPTFPGLD